jgi:hypothetical protein
MTETRTKEEETVLALLRRLSPREQLRVIARVLPEAERGLELSDASVPAKVDISGQPAEARFLEALQDMGLIEEIRDPSQHPFDSDRTPPAEVEGIPLSEMIIAERR